jgi:hypothetical protein
MKIVDGLSYNTVKKLNGIIDTKLPGRAPFRCKTVEIGGKHLEFHFRDVLESLRLLYGDPQFKHDLAFAPERRYTSPERTCRIYDEMNTGDWWRIVQVRRVCTLF